jgi:hypothetical protein
VFNADSWVAMFCNTSQLDSLLSEHSELIVNNRLIYRPIKIELTNLNFNPKYTVIFNCVQKNLLASFSGKADQKRQQLLFNSTILIYLISHFYVSFITVVQNTVPLIFKLPPLPKISFVLKNANSNGFYPSLFLPLPTIQTGDAQWL